MQYFSNCSTGEIKPASQVSGLMVHSGQWEKRRLRGSVLYFVNYTMQAGIGRTSEVKKFNRLKDANEFSNGKYGFIIRYDAKGNKFHSFFGGFSPSAYQASVIESVINAKA